MRGCAKVPSAKRCEKGYGDENERAGCRILFSCLVFFPLSLCEASVSLSGLKYHFES